MSDRFYTQQLNRTGNCPGNKSPKKRKRQVPWDEDKKQAVISAYQESEPTPETSMEIVKALAEEYDESPNGVRMILTKAGVYVKKSPESAAKSSGGSTGGGRVSKADAIEALSAAISDAGQEVDEAIVSKLTGKAAVYFKDIIVAVNA